MPFLDATTGGYPVPRVSLQSATAFTLLTPLVYRDRATTITVPAPCPTDFASIPPWLWGILAPYGKQTLPAILHDYLCDQVSTDPTDNWWDKRKAADETFRRALQDQANAPAPGGDRSVSRVRATLFWAGVSLDRYKKYRFGGFLILTITALALSVGLYTGLFLWASGLDGWARLGIVLAVLAPSLLLGLCASVPSNSIGVLLVVGVLTAVPVLVVIAFNYAANLVLNVLPWVVPWLLLRPFGGSVGAPPEIKPTLGAPLG